MTVCRYFLQGRCQYGTECRFEHPRGPRQPENKGSTPHPPAPAKRADDRKATIRPEDVVKYDLATVNTEWPLSCYGLNMSWESGNNIVHGDYSPEELRLEAYFQSRSIGNIDAYKNMLAEVLNQKSHQIKSVLQNPTEAIKRALIPRYRPATLAKDGYHVPVVNFAAVPGTSNPLSTAETSGISQAPTCPTLVAPADPVAQAAAFESFTFGDIPEIPPPI